MTSCAFGDISSYPIIIKSTKGADASVDFS